MESQGLLFMRGIDKNEARGLAWELRGETTCINASDRLPDEHVRRFLPGCGEESMQVADDFVDGLRFEGFFAGSQTGAVVAADAREAGDDGLGGGPILRSSASAGEEDNGGNLGRIAGAIDREAALADADQAGLRAGNKYGGKQKKGVERPVESHAYWTPW